MSTPKLSAQELAPLLETDARTIYNWVSSGRLTAGRSLSNRLQFDPAKVAEDYKRAGVELPAPLAAYLAPKSKTAPKARAETRGAA